MQRFATCLLGLLLVIVAGCSTSFENQCDQYSAIDDQVACLDSAFMELRSNVEDTDDADRNEDELGQIVEYCEGLWEQYLDEDEDDEDWDEDDWDEDDEEWDEYDGDWDDEDEDDGDWNQDDEDDENWDEDDEEWDEYDEEELLEFCMGLLERLEDSERVDDDGKADRPDPDEDEDDEDWGDEDDEGDELRDFLDLWERFSDEDERDRGSRGELDGIHQRTRGAVQRSEDEDERRQMIRDGLLLGRGIVDRLRGDGEGRDRSREPDSRTDDEDERPR